MKIALHGREFSPTAAPYVQLVFDELAKHAIEIQLSSSFFALLKQSGIHIDSELIYDQTTPIFDANFVFSMGGDGTFLETVSHVGEREIPILGINFGRLGFLAAVNPENIQESIEKLRNGHYVLDKRTMLHADSEANLYDKGTNFALNEIAISKTDTSSMIIIHTFINGEFLNSYWADGLMVATSTGSTGYSLSCGGPLVMPHSANFIITPICPHNLFVRPMIVSDESQIALKVESRSSNCLVSLDSRAKVIADTEASITISKERFRAKLVTLEGGDFLSTLRTKLGWGKDIRNPYETIKL